MLEGHSDGQSFAGILNTIIVVLIILNVAAFIAETDGLLAARYGYYFAVFEAVSVIIFTIEYILRIWTAPELPFFRSQSAIATRLAFAKRPEMLIDLAVIVPFYLVSVIPIDLRVIRVLRLLRLFKLSRYSPAMHSL
jgi:voltage-gated potassium channel